MFLSLLYIFIYVSFYTTPFTLPSPRLPILRRYDLFGSISFLNGLPLIQMGMYLTSNICIKISFIALQLLFFVQISMEHLLCLY
jgi:hypothetical protein